ncbi:MAG: ATP-binding protein [Candidatus Zambryskibacteria bacterium]|nr:ATP-binding protein [Candidatus Zambryskibacteria bacterium]
MNLVLDPINIGVMAVMVLNLSLGIFVFLIKRENKVNHYFFIFTIAATLWGLSMILFRSMAGFEDATAFARILYASAATIPYAFLFFIRVFPQEKYNLPLRAELYLLFPFLAVLVLSLLPDVLILDTAKPLSGEVTISFSLFYHSFYALYIISYFTLCYGLLLFKYLKFTGIEKQQITYVIVGTFIATLLGVCTNLVMPLLGYFEFNWLGQIGIVTMVAAISFSILKHKLFNLKIVATQFIVYALCVSLFIRLLISTSASDLVVNGIFLLVSILTGILLIKSVQNEVAQREKVERLAFDLEHANSRLKELDQMKSEFLSLATHQIRAPLTAVKGYTSLILEGDYGEVSGEVKGAVEIIKESCENLVVIVNEFLDISRIEQGKMKYTLADFDMKAVAEHILLELKPNIESAGLTYEFHAEDENYMVYADQGKIRQVIGNLVDNAIKYTPAGGMVVTISRINSNIRFAIKDTGIGISAEDVPKLFNKFTRTKDASKQNVIGTGLGIYVAKQMIEAQGGKIWLESEGAGLGTTFFVELPQKM